MSTKKTLRGGVLLPVGLLLLGAIWVALSPTEKVLGQGIKIVYVHVASIWVGLVSFLLWGGLGVGTACLGSYSKRLQPWMMALGWMAVGWFALGVSTSMLAAKINWGDIYWAEPRMKMAIQCWMVGLCVHTINLWMPSKPQIQGVLAMLPGAFVAFSLWYTPLVLHPRKPVSGDDAAPFLIAFGGLFVIAALLALWLTRWLVVRSKATS